MTQIDLEQKTANAFAWKGEVLVVGFLAMLAAVMLFWDINSVPGGLHWEHYDFSFIAGLIGSGRVPANELWRELEGHSGMIFHCVLASLARGFLGVGWHTQGIALLTGLLAFLIYATGDNNLQSPPSLMKFWFLAGILMARGTGGST